MILEAKQMLESLEAAGWDLTTTHPDLKRPGRTVSVLANLDETGQKIESVEILQPTETLLRWTQANGNHNNYPVNKITGPFVFELGKKELEALTRERDDTKRAFAIEALLKEHGPIPKPESPYSTGFQIKLKERHQLLEHLISTDATSYLELLAHASSYSEETGANLLHQILQKIHHLAIEGDGGIRKDAQKILISLLFSPKEKAKVPVVWNLPSNSLSGRDSSSPANFRAVNEALLKANQTRKSESIICALTGNEAQSVGDKYPQPTFPAVGKTYLFSRNKTTPALGRYGVNGTDSYQIGEVLANQLASALSALTQPDRENKTWINIPSDKPKKSDLLIVFQGGLKDREIARAIGDGQIAIGEAHFEELTHRVLERAKGKHDDQIRGQMLLSVLSSVDPGNRKIILHKSVNLASLEHSAVIWTDACKNFKGRSLPLPFETGKAPKEIGSIVISPGTIPALTRSVHFSDGHVSPDTPGGFTFSESLDLLLGIENPNMVSSRLLTIAYKRLGNLLARTAEIHYRDRGEIYKFKSSEKWTCLKAQSLFAILLVSMNRPIEKTMNSLAYQLGQLCASFDILHAAYCHIERQGSLPPRLIGNSCFQASSRNPIAALGQLSSRAAPYLSRLKGFKGETANQFLAKVQADKSATNAIWEFLKLQSRLPEAAQKLAATLNANPEKVTDLFRAELLLGYLSGPELSEKSDPTSPQKA